MDTFLSFVKRRLISALLVVGAIVTFCVGFAAWWDVYPDMVTDPKSGENIAMGFKSQWTFALSQASRAFVFSDVYAEYTEAHFSPVLEGVGIAGSTIAFGAIIRAALAIFVKPIERIRASWRRGHVVVLGERDIAIRAAEKIEETGTVTYHGQNAHLTDTHVLTVPRPMNLDDRFLKSSIKRSKRVIVAEKDDMQTLETVLSISKFIDDEVVFAVFDNPWISLEGMHLGSFRETGFDGYIASRSVTRATARAALLQAPPFMLADLAGQSRIHALFVGFNALTLTMIEEILIANIVPGQKLPRFTILTNDAYKAEQAFHARHCGLIEESLRSDHGQIEIEFIENMYEGLTDQAARRLIPLIRKDPLSIVYVTLDRAQEPLAAAIAIQTAAVKRALFECPIFVRSDDGTGLNKAVWQDEFTPRGLYAFGGLDDLIQALGILEDEPDKLAREYHESYRAAVFKDTSTKGAWENLAEMFRRANQNAVLHLPAKLAAMGFDIRPYLKQGDVLSPSTAPKLLPGVEPVLNAEMREKLADMEHERWMVERWVAGWRHGERDNQHLRHPDLVPYAQLDEPTKAYDRLFVDWVSSFLERSASEGIGRFED